MLASWSCGSPCELGALFDVDGKKLAELQNFDVSPDGAFAVSLEILDLSTGDADVVVTDLRTGQTVSAAKRQPAVWGECAPSWQRTSVVFPACGRRAHPVAMALRTAK